MSKLDIEKISDRKIRSKLNELDKTVNYEKLYTHRSELFRLSNEENAILGRPQFNFTEDFATTVRFADEIRSELRNPSDGVKYELAKAVQTGDFRKIGAALVFVLGGAAATLVWDTARIGVKHVVNSVAKTQAKDKLLGYLFEATVKDKMVMGQLSKTNKALRERNQINEARIAEIEQSVQRMEKLLEDFSKFWEKIQ